jgi:competence protein ComFC
MAPVTFNAERLRGLWTDGYVLDRHSIVSTPTGDPYHPWDTKRTELGELLYQLKYGAKVDAMPSIVDTAEEFLRNHWKGLPHLDCVVPAPPSAAARAAQPVVELAKGIAARLGIQTCENAIIKAQPTQQMKNIENWSVRGRLLKEAIQKGEDDVRNKHILLFDDLIESGSTPRRVTELLLNEGGASGVYVLVLTRTKYYNG